MSDDNKRNQPDHEIYRKLIEDAVERESRTLTVYFNDIADPEKDSLVQSFNALDAVELAGYNSRLRSEEEIEGYKKSKLPDTPESIEDSFDPIKDYARVIVQDKEDLDNLKDQLASYPGVLAVVSPA